MPGNIPSIVSFADLDFQVARQVGIEIELLLQLVAESCRHLDLKDGAVQVELNHLFSATHNFLGFPAYSLADPICHQGYTLSIRGNADLIRQLVEEISSRLDDQISTIEIQLWCSICTGNVRKLMKCLEIVLDFGLFDKLATTSLLLFAIQQGNCRMLRLLLEFGVSPNNSYINFPQPLMQAARLGSLATAVRLNNNADAVFTRIVRALLKFGADPLSMSIHGSLPVHCLHSLAIRAPTVAATLINETPSSGFDALSSEFSNDEQMTPLSKCFHAISISRSPLHVGKILQNAVWPLIKIGAPMNPELNDWLLFRGLAKWNDPLVYSAFIEARRTSQLPVLKKYLDERPDSDVYKFANYIHQNYPRPLQSICRQAILRHLPKQPTLRSQAIGRLGLPLTLGSFLKFEEMSFPIR